jgi:flagellar protein FliO/FliZ
MFGTLFGSEIPLAARFFIAFLIVLVLIGLTAWLVRRFGANRLGGGGARGRQPRLAVIDAATVDGRRRLVLIRRDNVEHLLMIGGPTDVVVEPNIVRAIGANAREQTREATREPGRIVVAGEPTARQAPTVDGAWPLQPSYESSPIPAPRPYRSPATEEPWLAPEPGARPRPVDSLSGLAAELSTRLNPPNLGEPPARQEPAPRNVAAPHPEQAAAPAQHDRNLAEMAQQLEAALRRGPAAEGRPPVTDPLTINPAGKNSDMPARPQRDVKSRGEPKFDAMNEPKREARLEQKLEPKIDPKFEHKPETKLDPSATPGKNLYENLEDEMASLLSRPSGKT